MVYSNRNGFSGGVSTAARKTSAYIGVSQARWRGNAETQIFSQKWCPRIKHLGKDIHLGTYVLE